MLSPRNERSPERATLEVSHDECRNLGTGKNMVEYSPFSEEIIHGDPHPIYKGLRDEAPLYFIEEYDAWALSRFQDVWDASADLNFSSVRGSTTSHILTKKLPLLRMMNIMEPPDHTTIRSTLRPHFSRGRMRKLLPEFRQYIEDALDALQDRDEIDVVTDFAQGLATFVASTVAGFPKEDGEMLRDLVAAFFKRADGVPGFTEEGVQAQAQMIEYFVRLSEERRRKPSSENDVLSALHGVEVGGALIDDFEVATNLTLLLTGGTDTLPKVFANTVYRLYQNPGDRNKVVADPARALDAFHEALRLDMPTQNMCRSLNEDTEMYGTKMKAGQPVLLLYAAANRDEREFPEPDTFIMDRKPPRHLGFGHGTHACLGLHAARAEATIGLQEMLKRFPDYEVREEGLVKLQTEFVQGYSNMPIRLNAK